MKFHVALLSALVCVCMGLTAFAQDGSAVKKFDQEDKFRQLEEILPTANDYRTSSGAPGHGYWQQRADYVIDVELDDENQRIIGKEQITYHNSSPDELRYLWLQLDQNIFRPDSDANLTSTAPDLDRVSFQMLKGILANHSFPGGMNITRVEDVAGNPLKHVIVKTMMRIDLPRPLRTGESTTFKIDWDYNINDCNVIRGRSGYEYFKEDGNYLYGIAQWFPRMVAYTDANGWQHKQFLGRGEFTLELGDYEVRLTVPDDHIAGATGILQNPEEVLTETQRQRLREAKVASRPMFIVTPEEAAANETSKPAGKKTWVYKAENVRDFAFCSSRKFIWDAQGHNVNGNEVLAMSYYPKEGEPLWSKYSTHSIIHTLNVYSRYTFDYPYPIAISVSGPISGGMEYPMICFNGPRPEKDGTYSARTKYGLISVIIHEVGHNYFPMIVNSDERQWTWMDEGLNTFLQYLCEQEWEENYPSRRGEPQDIVEYMASTNQVPIMTNSESLLQFGPNGYSKPATALNVLRETVLGRELFDYAFKEYAVRWKFKRPMPADFFRTMEDASGVDLDWFWRGWFYSTDHCDIGIDNVRVATMKSGNPYTDKAQDKADRNAKVTTLSQQRNKDLPLRIEEFPELGDFYNQFDELDITDADRKQYEKFLARLDDEEKELLKMQANFYVVDLKNVGGLVMPVILKIEFEDGTEEELRIPAEIWRYDNERVSKLILTPKIISQITLDPHLETADVDLANNFFPPKVIKSRFEMFKQQQQTNPMRDAQQATGAAGEATNGAASTGGGGQ
ncbi:MAG: M1 family metallopeptidase [Pirellulales bacterium]|nr:M1 family metallopeptidase [Pirellulales bacterium]